MMRSRRQLLSTVVLSAGVHGAVFLGLTLVEAEPRGRGPGSGLVVEFTISEAPKPRPEPRDAESRPVAEAAVERPPIAAMRPRPAARRTARPANSPRPPDQARTSAPGPTGPTRNPLLAMRTRTPAAEVPPGESPRHIDLSPRRAATAVMPDLGPEPRSPLVLPGLPTIPGPKATKSHGPMIPDGHGTYRFDHGGFSAKVERDGEVRFKDKPSFQPYAEGPCLSCIKGDLSKYADDPSSGRVVDIMALLPKVGMRFDLTDWAMRRIGDDPYDYEKERFLNDTREQRAEMRRESRDERLREALQVLPGQLAEIWARTDWPPRRRRRILFDLWDECAETGPAERVRVARQIRATIIAFIRKRIPAGSAHAYPRAEIAQLNAARTSKAEFTPYPEAPSASP